MTTSTDPLVLIQKAMDRPAKEPLREAELAALRDRILVLVYAGGLGSQYELEAIGERITQHTARTATLYGGDSKAWSVPKLRQDRRRAKKIAQWLSEMTAWKEMPASVRAELDALWKRKARS